MWNYDNEPCPFCIAIKEASHSIGVPDPENAVARVFERTTVFQVGERHETPK
jgi:hypothetical protein